MQNAVNSVQNIQAMNSSDNYHHRHAFYENKMQSRRAYTE